MAKLRVDKIAAPIVKDEFTGSVQFDGTGDYLSMSDSSDFAFGTGDFTVECFIYPTGNASYRAIVDCRDATTQATGWILGVDANDNIYIYNDGFLLQSGSGATPEFKWYHVAYVRNNGTHTLYVDGVSVASSSSSYNYTVDNCVIGAAYTKSGEYCNGYISNVRLCKGHAVYTENFTVPTRELEVHLGAKGVVFPAADNRTVLLACQSSTDTTAEATGRHILTANGDATAADANPGLFRRTNISSTTTETTGAVYFDGTGDYLSISESGFTNIDSGDAFTIESFVYFNDLDNYSTIFASSEDSFTSGGFKLEIYDSKLRVQGTSFEHASGSTTLSTGQWYHFAFSRTSGGNAYSFVDGVLVNSTTNGSATFEVTWPRDVGIGGKPDNTEHLNGYISNLRFCDGHALYTSNFAPPTKELEVHPETILLCCYDGENIFADKTGNYIISAYGDRTSSPTPTATDSPIGITTENPGLTRDVDNTFGPTFQGGAGFTSQNWLTLPKGTTTERFPDFATNAVDAASARGLIAGGFPSTDVIQYVTIATLGDAIDFGNLHAGSYGLGACASRTRGLFLGGDDPAVTNRIQYVTIESTGNTTDFGNLTVSRRYVAGCSNSTRGVAFGGGSGPGAPQAKDEIDYVTIASTGDAIDFGNLTGTYYSLSGCSSPVRGLSFGGRAGTTYYNAIDYITIASTGNAQDFGDLATLLAFSTAASNSTRGMVFGGLNNPANVNTIQFVTIASSGNTQDFGDLTEARRGRAATASATRAIAGGGYNDSDYTNAIEYVTISTTGNAVNFGDQINTVESHAGCSNGHGGLG